MSTYEIIDEETPHAKIRVIGVGGAGGNAVNNMIASGMTGVDFVVVNTDAQDLARSMAPRRLQLGSQSTKGLGAGLSRTLVEKQLKIASTLLNSSKRDMVLSLLVWVVEPEQERHQFSHKPPKKQVS